MSIYKRHRFPSERIQYAVWLYFRFNLSHHVIEGLLAQRDIILSHEAIRLWCNRFGAKFARRIRRKHKGFGDTFYLDEVFVKINAVQHYLWRAVDQDGDAAKRFFKRPLKSNNGTPRKIVTDKLRSYKLAHKELMPDVLHDTSQYANSRAELPHQQSRVRERGMRKFKSTTQAQ